MTLLHTLRRSPNKSLKTNSNIIRDETVGKDKSVQLFLFRGGGWGGGGQFNVMHHLLTERTNSMFCGKFFSGITCRAISSSVYQQVL